MPDVKDAIEQNIHAVDEYFNISRILNDHGCHHGMKPAIACSEQFCNSRDVQRAWVSMLRFLREKN